MEQNLSIINDLIPVLTSGDTGVWVCDTSSGQFDFKNDFFSILGLTRLGVKFSSLDELRAVIHADDLPDFELAFADASAGKKTTVTYRCCSEDQQMQVESRIMSCGNGVIACTRNKDTALQSLEKQYKMVVNSLFPHFIWVFDSDFHIVDVILPDGLKLFHSREQLIGTDARNYYSPEVNELIITNIRESLKNNQWREIEYHIDLFGTRYYYRARIVPIDDNKVFCLCMEIGERVRRMDELLTQRQCAEESDRQKSVFMANISHEIRTPLNAIVGLSELLINEEMPEKRQEYIDIIYRNNKILIEIINNILELSRIEAGMSEFYFNKTDVVALVKKIAEFYIPDLKPEVCLQTDITDTDIQVFTDADKVKQVLDNLISNAIKYTTKGTITLKVSKDEDNLIFSVADSGCGITEDKLEAIFNRFEKIGSFVQGTGLGLSLSEVIAERLGGKITVTSKVGEGSVFSFSIPYRHVASEHKSISGMSELYTNMQKKIMVFETIESDMQSVREILNKKYDVMEITDIEKIVSSFILDQPNLIMVNMQAAGRKDIIAKIRAITPNIPIIAMTTSDYYHDQRMAFENGCTDVIAKPFSSSKLEEFVMAFIL